MRRTAAASPSGGLFAFTLAAGVALTLLLTEWLILSGLGLDLRQGEVSRTLTGLFVDGLLAAAAGLLVALAGGRRLDPAAAAVAAVLAALAGSELFLAIYGSLPLKLLAAGGVALMVFMLVLRVWRVVPVWMWRPALWWRSATLLAVVQLAMTAVHAPDTVSHWVAAGAALLALALLPWRQGSGFALPLLVAAALFLGSHVPVMQPLNAAATGKPSVLLVTIDTLRADRVGSFGYSRARTPVIDGLGAAGFRFAHDVTANIFTGPSHASILTGLYPETHGMLRNNQMLDASVTSLADILADNGYITAAFTSAYTTLAKVTGLPSRFQYYDDDYRAFRWLPEQALQMGSLNLLARVATRLGWHDEGSGSQRYRSAADTANSTIAWLAANGGRPFLLWMHLYDPHVPYTPPREYLQGPLADVTGEWYRLSAAQRADIILSPQKVEAMHALYDAEVAYDDAELGRVVAAARAAVPDGNLLIVVTSHHGESMGEHNLYWQRGLYDPTLLVPLVIVPPAQAGLHGHVVEPQVRSIDIVPTILDLLGIAAPAQQDGASLVGLMQGTSDFQTGPAFSSVYPNRENYARVYHPVRDNGWQLIQDEPGWVDGGRAFRLNRHSELYDLASAPAELSGARPERLEALDAELAARRVDTRQPEQKLTDEARERLRSLGYIQ